MAATAEKTPDFEIEMYKPEEDGKPYRAHVQALVAADENRSPEQVRAGEHASIKVTFPKEENGKPAIERHKRWFRESAAPDLSAKIVGEVESADSIEFRYIVVPKIERPRKPKPLAGEASDTDVPEAEDANDDEKDEPKAA